MPFTELYVKNLEKFCNIAALPNKHFFIDISINFSPSNYASTSSVRTKSVNSTLNNLEIFMKVSISG